MPAVIAIVLAATLGSVVAERSARHSRPEEAKPLTYVAIGASDGVGVGANAPETEGWVPVLHSRLPRGSRLVNLGVSGSLLSQALDQQLPVAVASNADLVTVWLAVNDLNARVPLEQYSADLDRLLRTLREQTNAAIFVGNVPDVAGLPVYRHLDSSSVRREVDRWNSMIGAIAERHGAILVDLHQDWQELSEHPEYVGRDGFHPSTEGYRRLADIFQTAVAERSDLL